MQSNRDPVDDTGVTGQSAPTGDIPDLLALLARVSCHVYTGELLPDGEYRELFTGPGIEELLGGPVPPGVDPTDAWHAAVHPEDWNTYLAGGIAIGAQRAVTMEYRLIGQDGRTRWVLDRMWLRDQLPDGPVLVDGVITDVSELHERNAQLRSAIAREAEATAWLEAAVEASPSAMIMLDNDARVRLWNPAAERLFGWTHEEAIGEIAPHVPPDRREKFLELLERARQGEQLLDHEDERVNRDGERCQISLSTAVVYCANGEISGYLGMLTDITARKEMEDRLRMLAHRDSLTGLANRALITERIDEAVARTEVPDHSVALLLLDLDGFKAVNDSFGHALGDELLVAVAGRLMTCLRANDLAARLGGDEFAVLLETVDLDEAVQVGDRILEALSAPFALSRAEVVVTASVGVVHAEKDRSTQDLLRDADVAMYMAKSAGKNRLVVFQRSMQQRVATRMQLESELRNAVVEKQFELHYQPLINLDTLSIVGVEALLRWRHPTRGLLGPAEFVDVAEETGLIVPIGRWVVDAAISQVAQWQPADPAQLLSVGVNVSPRQLHDEEFFRIAAVALRNADLPPAALTVEITENLLLGDSSWADERLAQLRGFGVRIAVDDFGTGYSSLAYLRRYPVDVLKIDRSFVEPLSDDPRPAALVRSIIDLAAALDMDTVAEGVETQAQAEVLNSLGCHVAQGFYFARPQPADVIGPTLLAGERSFAALPRATSH
jgi:diguanylate cyclase (GGDEF)-like protein/PAS domain S-box-containing protein